MKILIRKAKGRKRYTLNNVNRQKITSRMLEDEALGFCYALQCYSSQNEQDPSPMAPSPMALNEYFSSDNLDNWNKCITFAA